MKTAITMTGLSVEAKRQAIRSALENTKGRFFTVKFTKKDGSERIMTARLGVKVHTKGGNNTTAHIPNMLTVWEPKIKQYRNINLDTVHYVHANRQSIEFN